MSETYTAAQKTVASRPRSQRLRDTAGSSSASASAASAVVGDQYWAMETQDDGTSALKTDNLIKVLEGIRIVKDGHEIVLSIDENGNLFINGNVGVYGDVAAYAAIAAQYETIKGYVNEYLAGRGVTPGGGGGTINTIEVTGTGNVMTGVTLSEDLTKLTFTLGLKVYDWALQATKPGCSFSELTGKPTTLAGYGITDAAKGSEAYINRGYVASGTDLNSLRSNGAYIIDRSGIVNMPDGAHTYGVLSVFVPGGTKNVVQMYVPHQSDGTIYTRTNFDGSTWTLWHEFCDDAYNAANYLGKTAKAASASTADSATTAASCSGNAATATKLATARSIFGNNFDGSADITNNLKISDKLALYDYGGAGYWLGLNASLAFAYGVYLGQSMIRTDNEIQVGASGSAFKASANGAASSSASFTTKQIILKSPDGTKTRTISVDNSGNLCVDGTIAASGDVVAYK